MSIQTCNTPARHVRDSLSWMSQQLEIIFGELGIVQYLNDFVDQGFDSWETILDITESDLDALGVKLGHRRKLQRRIANSRGVAPGTSLAPTSQSGAEDTRLPDAQRSDPPRPDVRETNTVIITKRKYRRHPKPDENAPERPPSAYVLFSNKMREELKGRNLTFTEIAKLVGENWQSLSQSEKEPFESQAQAIKDKYHSDLAEYKKTPMYKKYMLYLQEFKAKHASQSQDKDVSKRVKLESGVPGRGSAAIPNRGSRSASRSEDRQPSEPPRNRNRLDSTVSANESPYSPTTTPASPQDQESVHSPTMSTVDRHSAERSPTFSTSPGELPPIPARRTSNWMEDQRVEHHGPQRHHLPSLSDVFESQRLASVRHPQNDVNGYGFHRDHPSPGPIPSLVGGDNRPPILRKEDSSAGSASSGSSYGYPRTPIDGTLPIHALLTSKPSPHFEPGQQQSYFQAAHIPEHKSPYTHHIPNGVSSPGTNGYHNGAAAPHPSTVNSNRGYSTQPPTSNPPQPGKPDANLDGMSALLKAGEMVDRRP